MHADGKPLSVIIVHFNEIRFLKDCFDSLRGQGFKDFKVFIVDNASKPQNRKLLIDFLKGIPDLEIDLILNKYDLFFSGGANKVLKQVTSPYVCLMNPDVALPPDLFEKAIKFLESDESISLFAPKALVYGLKNRVLFAGGQVRPFTHYFSRHVGYFRKDSPEFTRIYKTDFLNAACLFARNEVFQKTGLFDELFFSYVEDGDFSFRARKAGYSLIYNGNLFFYHKVPVGKNLGRMSVRNSEFHYYLILRNRHIFLWKDFPISTIIGSYFTWSLYNLIAATILNILFRKFALIRLHLRAMIMGTLQGIKRRTNRSCQSLFKKEIKFIYKISFPKNDRLMAGQMV